MIYIPARGHVVRHLAQAHGLDGAAADAAVAHVQRHGQGSSWARAVGEAACQVYTEAVRVLFDAIEESMAEASRQFAAALADVAPRITAWVESIRAMWRRAGRRTATRGAMPASRRHRRVVIALRRRGSIRRYRVWHRPAHC